MSETVNVTLWEILGLYRSNPLRPDRSSEMIPLSLRTIAYPCIVTLDNFTLGTRTTAALQVATYFVIPILVFPT